jgi:hypothetical protein
MEAIMTLKSKLTNLERATPRPTGGLCVCGLVGTIIDADEPEPEPTICPTCGGVQPVLRIVERIVATPEEVMHDREA